MFSQQQENTAITKETFSTRYMPSCCNQDKLAVAVREQLRFSRCELLLCQAGSWGRRKFGNPEDGECPPLEAATKQRQLRHDSEH
jgi:hypothetical protein